MIADVAVVGAGPAGAWAAYCLARRGARVTIFDPSHPREKPCGGGVTGRTLELVGDALEGAPLPVSVIERARFIDSETGRSVLVPLETQRVHEGPAHRATHALIVVSRTDFDAALLAAACQAGATLVTVRVTDVVPTERGYRLDTVAGPRHATVVIGADGANSLVRRRLARPFRRDELSIATGYFAGGVTSDEIVLELLTDPPGYLWSFPRPTHLAIGICAQADAGITARALRARTANWINETHMAPGAPLEPYSWPIPSLSVSSLRSLDLAGPGWCLIGDAAGLVDPITREGLYYAMQSGTWAADAVLAGDTHGYDTRVRTELLPELARAAHLKARFFRSGFIDLTLHAIGQSAAVGAVMADLIAGRQPYVGLRRRLLGTFEIGLAWQVLTARLL